MSDEQGGPRCPFPRGSDEAPAAPGCPVTGARETGGPVWDAGARAAAERTARAAAPASHLDAERAAGMAVQVAEARARDRRLEQISDLFIRTLGRKLGHGHPLSDRTGIAEFTWTTEAEARLAEVPEFCRDLTRWRVEWTAHKKGLGTTITPEVMQVKYEMWGAVSHAIQGRRDGGLPWTESARLRFDGIPDFVQGQVLEAVEGNARALGAEVVDDAVVDMVIKKWCDTGDFHEGLYGFR